MSYGTAKLKKHGNFHALTWLIFTDLVTYYLRPAKVPLQNIMLLFLSLPSLPSSYYLCLHFIINVHLMKFPCFIFHASWTWHSKGFYHLSSVCTYSATNTLAVQCGQGTEVSMFYCSCFIYLTLAACLQELERLSHCILSFIIYARDAPNILASTTDQCGAGLTWPCPN